MNGRCFVTLRIGKKCGNILMEPDEAVACTADI
jgi:hypothetical protein